MSPIFGQQKSLKSFQLNWQNKVSFKVSNQQNITTSIVKGNFIDGNLIPSYTSSWEVSKGESLSSFFIKNVKYQLVNNEEFKSLSISKIPNKINANFHIVNARNKTLAVLTLNPLVYENSQLKKVVSFDVEYVTNVNRGKSVAKSSSVKNSVLETGAWYKFAIDTTGVYKIDKSFLQKLGLNTTNINPKNIQIFGNGGQMLPFKNSDFRQDGLQENAIYIKGEEDNSFDDGDYILFYGKGPDTWKINGTVSLQNTHHQKNIFSDKAYYFITVGDTNGKRILNQPQVTLAASQQINNYDDFTFFEKDEVNLFAVGQQWFGDSFNIENVHTYTIPFENIDNSNNILVRVRGVAESGLASQFQVSVNNQSLFNVNIPANGGLTKAYAIENFKDINISGNSVNVTVTYSNGGNPSAKAYLDYIEVLGKKKLIANGKQFRFRNFDITNSTAVFEYTIQNTNNIAMVWNVSDYLNPINIENQATSSDFSFKVNGGSNKEYVVLNDTNYYTPEIIPNSLVENQNLHSLTNLDYIVITQDFLFNQAQRLVDYHQQNSNLQSKVISLKQIYNEFSSGSPDITAIRDFVKHLYDNSTTNRVKYVCLFGDASYDYKDRINGNNNIVPVFEAYNSFNLATSFVTDDFYGMMDANEGQMQKFEKQDVATGRIPVSDVLQAQQVVDKILNYNSTKAFGSWRNQVTLIADDIDAAGEETLQLNMERLADTISVRNPIFNLKKIYIDAYEQQSSAGGSRYPTVNTAISNQVEKGTLVIDYFGHGGEDGWAAERILEVPEIQNWKNEFRLPLFVTATCEFSRFDNPLRKTAGEYVLWNKNGGAASLISTTREIFISVGEALNKALIEPLLQFNNENYSIAESLMITKNKFSTNQRYFVFTLGDPAMKLNVPKPLVKLTKMNDVSVTQSLDTIKALSHVKFEGEVTNSSGTRLSNFNGEFEVTVFDKPVSKTTLDNDNHNITMQFDAIESKIFNGRSKVENGLFTFDFVAPKDLKIAYGKGKLSLYAFDAVQDKAGANFDIVVGGINANAPEDNTGPTVQLYMNDLNFVDGGNTNESPLFIAVLQDENGINTSLTAVDHDIVAILDNDESNPIVLNDYYQTELNNYKKGQVNYPFRNLAPGLHTITLKVWDTYNNLTETSFTFFVVSDSDLVLSNVLNYPNPFVNYTEFWFNHNKPNEELNVQIQIFTISGKLVKTINKTILSVGNLSRSISWNGLDDFGSKIGKGVYVYKLKVSSLNSNTTAQKIEKLVILQ
ncbi:type IX secretion system sortase PorU [Lutibacter sp.]|uniref:type IX secretion system sortase PorU n=1 Tax=Lutibacter sp. TaxID=1925666 RepID=UPI0025C1ECA0|nr:type IX secretion system sortase PorU [Lutibacter sp.]MCF6182013.1 type IX secretion system sortase PorU [Lutibacter sp.]